MEEANSQRLTGVKSFLLHCGRNESRVRKVGAKNAHTHTHTRVIIRLQIEQEIPLFYNLIYFKYIALIKKYHSAVKYLLVTITYTETMRF